MLTLRRFLVIVALMFWQGGFTFYAAVVVPVGQEVLGSHLEQGFITRVVTRYLNIAGAAALGLLALELLSCPLQHARLRWFIWAAMVLALVTLIALHPMLDSRIDVDARILVERAVFRLLHRVYLWVSTLEWVLGGMYLWLLLRDWAKSELK
jgi:hypothetical protein